MIKLKVETNSSLEGLKIKFPNNRIVEDIKMLSNKGATCTTYTGKIVSTDAKGQQHFETCLIKEFAPSSIARLNEVINEDEFYVSRVLPAQREKFRKRYDTFIKTMDKIHWIIKDAIEKDRTLQNYIVNVPDASNRVFECEESKGQYKGLMLFPYESSDADEKIKSLSIPQRLTMLEMLCKVVEKFNQQNIILVDLKPDNFIYYNDGINNYMRLFDFDSAVIIDEDHSSDAYIVNGTPFFSSPMVLGITCEMPDATVDTYSIASMLLYFICINVFEEREIDMKNFGPMGLEEMLSNETFEYLKDCYSSVENKDDGGFTIGFWNKFVSIIYKYRDQSMLNRLPKTEKAVVSLGDQIKVLREIYENKGVHPEVMLNNALRKTFNDKIESELLCDVE